MAQPRWQPESREAVVHALEEADSIEEAARTLGVATTTLNRYCRENDVDRSPARSVGGRSRERFVLTQEMLDRADATHGLTGLAAQFGVNPDTLRAAAAREGIDLSLYRSKGGTPVHPQGPPLPPGEQHSHNLEVARLTGEIAELKKLYREACKEENLHAELLEVAREAWTPYAPPKIIAPKPHEAHIVEDAILLWADWHGGEVVDYDVMQGYNAYDPTLMCRRAQYTVDTTIDALFSWHKGSKFERLWVFDLGDSINGELRDEQKATNAYGWCESVRVVAHVRARALHELSAHVPVVYIAVPGNHGRLSKSLEWKRPTENGDWLVAEAVSDLCRGNDRIQCVSPKTWTANVTVRGWNFSLNHGTTQAKGGYGGISWYAIQRADGKLTALESAHGKHVHYRALGHIHQDAKIPAMDGEGELFVVGSLKGGDEYALHGLNAYAAPRQQLVGVHDDVGVSWRYPLKVARADSTPSRYEELLP